jgi:hypothetical protein
VVCIVELEVLPSKGKRTILRGEEAKSVACAGESVKLRGWLERFWSVAELLTGRYGVSRP